MEFAIQWRTENHLSTSAFAEAAAARNGVAPVIIPAKKAAKKAASKKAAAKKVSR